MPVSSFLDMLDNAGFSSLTWEAVIVVIIPTALFLRRRFWGRVCAEPTCFRCGYTVVGLPSNICPECGSDLQKTGVLPAMFRQPMARGWSVAIWTLWWLALGAGVILAGLRYDLLPVPRTWERKIYVQTPDSGLFVFAMLHARTLTPRWSETSPENVGLYVDGPAGPMNSQFYYQNGKTWYIEPRRPHGWAILDGLPQPEHLIDSCRVAGTDVSRPEFRREMAEVCALIHRLLGGERFELPAGPLDTYPVPIRYFKLSCGNLASTAYITDWYLCWLVGVWVAVWIVFWGSTKWQRRRWFQRISIEAQKGRIPI